MTGKKKEIVFGIVLTVLFVILIFTGVKLVSSFFLPEVVGFRNETFFIERSVLDDLNDRLVEGGGLEFGVCLVRSGDVIIGLEEVATNGGNGKLEWLEDCAGDRLVSLHSHPSGTCIPSAQDGMNYAFLNFKYGNEFNAIMCGRDKIAVYKIDNLKLSYNVEIVD